MKSLLNPVTSPPVSGVGTEPAAPRGTWASALPAATLLMGLSGFAGLGYQIVWTEQFGVWLGHDIVAVLAVVAAFFGGLGLGACLLAKPVAASPRPVAWYAGCEVAIALWGLALSWLLPAAGAWLAALTGPQPSAWWQWTLAFIGPFLLLLPATCAMGATLPAIERISARLRSEGYAIGGLYAANTLGAVFGVLASAFVLVPWLGLARTAQVCVALNLLCAALALTRFAAGAVTVPRPAQALGAVPGAPPGVSHPPAARRVLGLLVATGALGIGYEVVVVRVLSQVAQDTVYTFALLLAAYLAGTAGGAAFYQRRLAGRHDAEALRMRLLCALAASCLVGTLSLWPSDALRAAIANALGANISGALTAEAVIALAAFALPTFVMGALFSHLCVEAKAAGRSFGVAIGINTLGAAFAPLLFGVLLMPWLGAKTVLLVIAVGYLLLVPPVQWKRVRVWAPAVVAAALALFTGELAFIDVPDGGRIVSYQDGVMATVSVVEDGNGVARLRINNRQQEGSSASLLSDARQAYLPLLLHAAPHDVLFLGLGTGITAASAAEDRTLNVTAVELLPEVVAAAPLFAAALGAAPGTPAPQVLVGDARRHVRTTGRHYDVIVADLFHPARSGAGALYTAEHFAAIRARLRADGLFCQWLPLHQLDLDTLRSITASFTQAYPGAMALLATHSLDTPVLGLIARADGAGIDLPALQARLAHFPLPARLAQLQLIDEFAVLGSLVAGPRELARFAAGAPLNTDDRPVVVHRAPFITYAPDSLPRDRLRALLQAVQPHVDELLAGSDGPDAARWRQRLTAYWAARAQFIEAGMAVRAGSDPQAMLAQVRAPLLAVLRTSADFRPAYDPLLNLARAVARSDLAGARALLAELAATYPSRPDAALLLRQLAP